VWTTFWSEATGWNPDWFPVPGQAVFDRDKQHMTVVSRKPGQLDLFVIGFDNHVWTTFWNASNDGVDFILNELVPEKIRGGIRLRSRSSR
jgi:hypothetical protein